MGLLKGYIASSVLKGLASYFLGLSFPPSVPSLDKYLARDGDWDLRPFFQTSSSS